MTIRRGQPWGREVPRPTDLEIVRDDAAVVAALDASPPRPIALGGGDLARTLGNPAIEGRTTLLELPIDLMSVTLDARGDVLTACAHVVARSPWYRGGWWRGPVVLVMNSEFRGRWDVAPRGHPNDGRVETFEVDASFGWRERVAARRRLPAAGHVPHPAITTRSVRTAGWTFVSPLTVFVDGRRVGRARTIEVTVVADAATVYA